jgi:hypothetical protein
MSCRPHRRRRRRTCLKVVSVTEPFSSGRGVRKYEEAHALYCRNYHGEVYLRSAGKACLRDRLDGLLYLFRGRKRDKISGSCVLG